MFWNSLKRFQITSAFSTRPAVLTVQVLSSELWHLAFPWELIWPPVAYELLLYCSRKHNTAFTVKPTESLCTVQNWSQKSSTIIHLLFHLVFPLVSARPTLWPGRANLRRSTEPDKIISLQQTGGGAGQGQFLRKNVVVCPWGKKQTEHNPLAVQWSLTFSVRTGTFLLILMHSSISFPILVKENNYLRILKLE